MARGNAPDVPLPDGSLGSAVRRAPFADNPIVGARGQEAFQRILTAALAVFDEVGYHQCRVHRITEVAGCSRVSFYQYFSSKEDLFRYLAGRLAQRLRASLDAVGPISADASGRAALAGYFERYSEIYDEYRPIFIAFQTAASSDAVMAEGGERVGLQLVAELRSKVVGSGLDRRAVQPTVRAIAETAVRANRLYELVVGGVPPDRLERGRLNAALADVGHRALFGCRPGINVAPTTRRTGVFDRPGGPVSTEATAPGAEVPRAGGSQTRAAILEAGRRVYAERGYYSSRVDDIVRQAGVSHGAFYRYFQNKDELFGVLAGQASRRFLEACDDLGRLDLTDPDARATFRAWLADYVATCAEASAIMQVLADAIVRDPRLGGESADVIRAGCRSMVATLRRRGGGDVEPEALVLLVLLDELSVAGASAPRIDAVGGVIERGLLFLDAR